MGKPLKIQLGTDTVRNAGVETYQVGTDLQQQGYRALPNERETTGLRNYQSNLKTETGGHTSHLQDELKKTKKQTTINTKNNGYVTTL